MQVILEQVVYCGILLQEDDSGVDHFVMIFQ